MKKKTELTKPEQIVDAIYFIRGQRVILDTDLAKIYGVKTKSLNLAVKRNGAKFPADFMFHLTPEENKTLRFQIETSKKTRGGRRYLPHAFTEHGAIMAANILNSERAVEMSVFVVRAFVKMRAALSSDKGLAEELKNLERKLTGRLDAHEIAIVDVLRLIIINLKTGNQCCPCRPSRKRISATRAAAHKISRAPTRPSRTGKIQRPDRFPAVIPGTRGTATLGSAYATCPPLSCLSLPSVSHFTPRVCER